MLVSCSYSPDSSGAGLKTNKPFTMPKTVCPGSSGVPFTDNCIPWGLGAGTIVGVGVGIGDGVNVGYGVNVGPTSGVGQGVYVGCGVNVGMG